MSKVCANCGGPRRKYGNLCAQCSGAIKSANAEKRLNKIIERKEAKEIKRERERIEKEEKRRNKEHWEKMLTLR